MKDKSEVRNNSFNIWRVFFTLIIMMFHFSEQYNSFYDIYQKFYYHWYVAVEFFFILSGFLMAEHAVKNEGESALKYSIGRIKRLYPQYIIVFLIMIVISSRLFGQSIISLIIGNWEEIFMLQSIGTGKFPYINNPAWYVSALFIAGHFIYYLLQRHKKMFLEFIGPILLLGLLKLFYQDYEALNSFFSTSKFGVSSGVLRAIIGLIIGIYGYYLSKQVIKSRGIISRVVWAIAEVGAFLFVVIFSITHENKMYDFAFLFIMAFGVFAASKNSLFKRIAESTIIKFLCKLSYGMFLTHFVVLTIMGQIWPGTDWRWELVPLYLVATIALAIIVGWVEKLIMKVIIKKS